MTNVPTYYSLLSPEQQQWLDYTTTTNTILFGGYTMEGEEEGEQPAEDDEGQEPKDDEPQEPDDKQAEEPVEEPEGDDEGGEGEESTLSPEDALKAVSKLRKENANWRKKFRDLEGKMAEAVTPEQIADLRTELAAEQRSLLVENVALKYDLPAELAERLSGANREELEADAKKLTKFVTKVTTNADNLRGGLDPSEDEGEFDPVAIAKANRRRARNY